MDDAGTSGHAMAQPLVSDELESVVSMLCARHPQRSRAEVQSLVADAYQKLCGDARIHAHLIPLTLNRCRRVLSSDQAGRPKDNDDYDVRSQPPAWTSPDVGLARAAV